ncbi:tubulin-specific chaperone D [Bacillus rossius redtenbacheri]|uniref:tubulin-specific chaperone D n=1 Tax=Bacillus rossius redtenbacheri TaxID=93214 RepID=UPI002FDDD409
MASECEEDGLVFKMKWNVSEELEKIIKMVENLQQFPDDICTLEKAYEDFWQILTQFQEQPHLLDGHLEMVLTKLVSVVMNPRSNKIRIEAFKYLHTVMKVRGYKRVVRYLSHEVTYLEPIMKILESADVELECWQAYYVLLVWLSILVLTPFPMSHFDSPPSNGKESKKMMLRIESVIKKHLMSADKFTVSASLAANFFTRIDVKEKMLAPFIDWLVSVISDKEKETIFKVTAMAGAAAILKRGEREDLIKHANKLLMVLIDEKSTSDVQSVLYRKYRSKLIQRIGLTFLKKWQIKWRYNKGCTSLMQNLALTNVKPVLAGSGDGSKATEATDGMSLCGDDDPPDEEQFDDDVLEHLSEVIDNLIGALEDSDTVVRWSAAKGIGRITERLTHQMGDMVLTSILDIFSDRKNHHSWHGACLALAQMASRGLLPKSRLMEVVHKVILALTYDEPRRFSSVGENVRDAACYVFWAFARAFNEDDLNPLSNEIMTNLLIVALFDREVHCRRAASAAFQEYVGRCSSDPDAISIMREADYMSVGGISFAYLHVSVEIAKIGGFTKAMIEHLLDNKVRHWDEAIRNYAVKALNLLTPFEPSFVASFLPKLVESAYSEFLTERLGASPAIGEIIHGLYVTGNLHDYIDDMTLNNVMDIIPRYRRENYFRGLGGEMIRGSCIRYIWKCSEARLRVDDVAEDWLFVIQDCIYTVDPTNRGVAVEALNAFLINYSPETITNKIVTEYISVLSAVENGNFLRSCGAAVLSKIPKNIFEKYLHIIIPALIKCTEISAETVDFAEARQIAIKGLLYISTSADVNKLLKDTVTEIFRCFLTALEDYTRNKKGDVGFIVRHEAAVSLFALTEHILTNMPDMLEESVVKIMVPKLMQLSLEPLDFIRCSVGEIFGKIIHREPEVPYIPEIGALKKIFRRDLCTNRLWWRDKIESYPCFIKVLLLMEPQYSHHILVGFMMTIGGVSESSSLNVSAIFFETLEEIPEDKAAGVAEAMLKVFAVSTSIEHLTTPALNFFKSLLVSGAMNSVLLDPQMNFASEILFVVKKKVRNCKEFTKAKAIVSILSELFLVTGKVGLEAFQILVRYLKHNSVAVRSFTAARMFETVSLLDDNAFPGCNINVVMKLLAETQWKNSVTESSEAVAKISEELTKATNM